MPWTDTLMPVAPVGSVPPLSLTSELQQICPLGHGCVVEHWLAKTAVPRHAVPASRHMLPRNPMQSLWVMPHPVPFGPPASEEPASALPATAPLPDELLQASGPRHRTSARNGSFR